MVSRKSDSLLARKKLAGRVAALWKEDPALEYVEAEHGSARSAFGVAGVGGTGVGDSIGVGRVDDACFVEASIAASCSRQSAPSRARVEICRRPCLPEPPVPPAPAVPVVLPLAPLLPPAPPVPRPPLPERPPCPVTVVLPPEPADPSR